MFLIAYNCLYIQIFNVKKERYEHLKELNLVMLVGIDKKEEKPKKKNKK